MAKIWFITGTSRGFGRIWAEAALKRGDKVAATARNTDSLKELVEQYGDLVLPMELDVNDSKAGKAAIAKAQQHFGRLDVVINNAGYGLFGTVEESTEEEVRAQFETNFFGALWITQAAIPIMRAQGSGRIIQVSSIGGVAAFPTLGFYNASKWALEAMSEALAGEVAAHGIKVTIVEPGGFATDWGHTSAYHSEKLDAYAHLRANNRKRTKTPSKDGPGDPDATDKAILKIVDAENPPLRLFLGIRPNQMIKGIYQKRLDLWEEWNEVAVEAHGG